MDELSSDDISNRHLVLDNNAKLRDGPTILCHAVFIVLGFLLLVAASFKTYQAFSEPMSAQRMLATLTLICFEVCFGSWLIAGVKTRWAWRAAIACYAIFAGVSAYKALLGVASCGCFGALEVHPMLTLTVDVLAVMLLIWCGKGVELTNDAKMRRAVPRVASIALVLSLLATSLSIFGNSRFVQGDGSLTSSGELVLLESSSWIGKRWPLLTDSGLETQLASGNWGVLLYRHDCHVCHDVMIELEQSLLLGTFDARVALIGIDERRHDALIDRLQGLGCQAGYLPRDREWFATTPLRLLLNDGVCVSAEIVESWK